MRLIDADWVLEHIKPYELSDEYWSVTGGTAIRLIHNAIDNAPTIDAAPVVRCRDCEIHGHCSTEDVFSFAGISNPFCCAGKRKDGDGDD